MIHLIYLISFSTDRRMLSVQDSLVYDIVLKPTIEVLVAVQWPVMR